MDDLNEFNGLLKPAPLRSTALGLFYFMAKRFTDTDKWKKPFIKSLQAPYKLLWLYICDDCDHAGIWQVDMEVAQIRVGEKLSESRALDFFGEKIIPFDNGTKWFIPSFLEFQYPTGLNPDNKAHGGIIKILEKYNLVDDNFKPLASPLNGAMDMDKDMDKVMDMDKDKDKDMDINKYAEKIKNGTQPVRGNTAKIEIIYPFTSSQFMNYWDIWKDYKAKDHKFKFKSAGSEQASLNELVKLAHGDEQIACLIIQQSMAKGWKGFFELKTENNGNTKTQQSRVSPKITDRELYEAFAKRSNGG